MTKEKYTFFYGGPFSQWYICQFYDEDKNKYVCAEQYMMAQKARMFGDERILDIIMTTGNPKQHKMLGRKVKNFDKEKWEEKAKDIVYQGNYYKFTQNKHLLKELYNTEGTILVEASPYDLIWGIGLKSTDERALNRENWLGKNWLGETLTRLREDLMEKENFLFKKELDMSDDVKKDDYSYKIIQNKEITIADVRKYLEREGIEIKDSKDNIDKDGFVFVVDFDEEEKLKNLQNVKNYIYGGFAKNNKKDEYEIFYYKA